MAKDNFWNALSSASTRCFITRAPSRDGGSMPNTSPRLAAGSGGAPILDMPTLGSAADVVELGRRQSLGPELLPVLAVGLPPPSEGAEPPCTGCRSPRLPGRRVGMLADLRLLAGRAIFKRKASDAGLCSTCRSSSPARHIIGGDTHVVNRLLSESSFGNGSSQIFRISLSAFNFFAFASRSRLVRKSSFVMFNFATATPFRQRRFVRPPSVPGEVGESSSSSGAPSISQDLCREEYAGLNPWLNPGLNPGEPGSDTTGLSGLSSSSSPLRASSSASSPMMMLNLFKWAPCIVSPTLERPKWRSTLKCSGTGVVSNSQAAFPAARRLS
mmetsp:Transcript_29680/g.85358  ORF Transcript_29680/g.85358 Transcript_29680/m.85358 type:complete len:328 (-) Transcript_29680:1028-2011(-)